MMPNERLVIRYEVSGRVSEVDRMRNENWREFEHCLRMFVSLPVKRRGFYSAGISRGSGQAVLIEGLSRARDAKSASIGGGESQSSVVYAPFQRNLTGIDACCSRDLDCSMVSIFNEAAAGNTIIIFVVFQVAS